MNKSSLDTIFLSLAAVALAGSIYLLVDDRWLASAADAASLEKVGQFAESTNDVRRKLSQNFVWLPARQADEIYEGDSVFTGENSEAAVQLENGSEIEISPNSLVVIRTEKQNVSIDLAFGDLVGKLKGGAQKIVIKNGKEDTVLSGESAEIAIAKSKSGPSEVRVVNGDVKVATGTTSRSLAANQSLELKTDGKVGQLKTTSISLESAKAVKTVRPGADIPFRWTSTGDAESYRIVVSTDRSFSNPIASKTVRGTETSFNELPSGKTLYWKVVGLDENGDVATASFPGVIKIRENVRPTIITPTSMAEVYLEANKTGQLLADEQINLSWTGSAGSNDYHVLISDDANFENRIVNKRVRSAFMAFIPQQPGTYYWRVRSGLGNNEFTAWSDPSQFTIHFRRPELPLQAPALVSQDETFTQPAQNTGSLTDFPMLQWQPIEGAAEYEIEIAKDANFEQIIEKSRSPSASFPWQQNLVGNFYWRVRGISENDVMGEFSPASQLTVQPPEEPLTAPIVTQLRIEENYRPNLSIPMSWSSVPGATHYEYEISQREDFSKRIVEESSPQTTYRFIPTGPGNYFWHVRARRDETVEGPWSTPVRITIRSGTLPQPILAKAQLNVKVSPYTFPPAPVNRSPKIQWQKVKGASKYTVQVAKDKNFNEIVEEVTSESNSYIWSNYQLGLYFFRVKSVSDDGRQSPYAVGTMKLRFPLSAMKKLKTKIDDLAGQYDTFRVDLSWQATAFTQKYRLKVGSDSGLKDGVTTETTDLSKSYKFKKADIFYWAILPIDKDGNPLSGYSAIQKIDLKKGRVFLAAPEPLLPQSEASLYFQSERFVSIQWSKVAKAERYELEIAKDAQFQKPIFAQQTGRNRFIWDKNVKNGTYYWRVRAANKRYKSKWSPPRLFQVAGPE